MKNWVFDSEDNTFVKTETGERVGLDDFRVFQSENHAVLRGVSGEERLNRFILAKKPAKEPKDAPLVIPALEKADATILPDYCMVCGHENHVGACQIV